MNAMDSIPTLLDKATRAMQYTTLNDEPPASDLPSSPKVNRVRSTIRLRQPIYHIGNAPDEIDLVKFEPLQAICVPLTHRPRNPQSFEFSNDGRGSSGSTVVASYDSAKSIPKPLAGPSKKSNHPPDTYKRDLTAPKKRAPPIITAVSSSSRTNGGAMASTDTASPRSGKVRRAARVPLRSFDDDSVHYSPDEPGPFRLLTRIANGAFGETFAVRELDPRWSSGGSRARGRTLCMKVFVKDDIVAHQFSQQVVQELLAYKNLAWAEKTKGLSFVMQVEAALEDSQRFYFIMELMRYDMLSIFAEDAKIRQRSSRRWIAQIAAGLSAIHKAGIIHRDIKPENILIDYRDNICITDFGSAYVNGSPIQAWGDYTDDVVGTWPYLAPEVLDLKINFNTNKPRKRYGVAVDWWALGCIAFELESDLGITAFCTEEDLQFYIRYRRINRSYFADCGLSVDAEVMINGLLRVYPPTRFGIADLYKQPYFLRPDGTSEFDDIEDRALSRRRYNFDYTLKDEIYPPAIISPKADYIPSLRPNSAREIPNFGWINPNGIWGKGIH